MFTISDLLSESTNEDERIAEDPSTPDSVLSKLADSSYPEVKRRVASNPNASLNTLAKVFLWQSAAVFENPSFVLSLMEDPSMENFVKLVRQYWDTKKKLVPLEALKGSATWRVRGEHEQLFYSALLKSFSSEDLAHTLQYAVLNQRISDDLLAEEINRYASSNDKEVFKHSFFQSVLVTLLPRNASVGEAMAGLLTSFSTQRIEQQLKLHFNPKTDSEFGVAYTRKVYEFLKSKDSGGANVDSELLKKLARSLP